MEHVGIDLGSRESQLCIRDDKGRILLEERLRTTELACYLEQRPQSTVVMETCAEAFGVARRIGAQGHKVCVVASTLVKSLGVGARGVKNDRRDAQVLSEVSARIELPSVHIPSEKAADRRTQCTLRDALVKSRTQLVNAV